MIRPLVRAISVTNVREFSERVWTLMCVVFLATWCVGQPVVTAAPLYWDTNGTTADAGTTAGTWAVTGGSSFWSPDNTGTTATGAWVDGSAVVFASGTNSNVTMGTVTVSGTVLTNSITFDDNLGITISGGTAIGFGGTLGTISSSAVGTANGKNVIISTALTGTAGLTIAAHGDLSDTGGGNGAFFQLGGNNSGLTGGITITSGLVNLLSATGVGSNDITLNGGGLLNTTASSNIALTNKITIGASGGTIRTYGGAGTAYTLSGILTGSGQLTKTDGSGTTAGALYISGASNTFTGNLRVGGGSIHLSSAGVLNNTGTYAGNLTTISGTTFLYETSATQTFSGAIANAGTFTVSTTTGTLNASGAITNTGTLSVSSGTLNLTGTITGAGATTQTGGTLKLDYTTNNTNKLSSGLLTMGGGTLQLAGNATTDTTQTAGGLTLNALSTLSFATQAGRTITLDTSSGTFTRNAKALAITTTGTGTALVKLAGTTANTLLPWASYNDGFATTNAGNLITAASTGTAAADLATWVTGSTQYTTAGAAFTNSVGTGVTIDGITFKDAAARTVTVGAGNTLTLNNGVIAAASVGNNASTISGGTIRGPASGTLNLLNNSSANLTISSIIADNSGATGMVKYGTGTVVINGDTNSFTGPITVDAGELQALVTSAVGAKTPLGTGAITVNSGAVLRFKTTSTSNAISFSNAINLNAATFNNEDGVQTINGALTTTGTSTINGVYSGKNVTFSGPVNVTGTLNLTGSSTTTFANTLSGTGTVSLNTGSGNFTYSGDNSTSGYSGTLNFGTAVGGTLTVSAGAKLVTTGSFTESWNKTNTINGTLTTGAMTISTNAATPINGTGTVNVTGLTTSNASTALTISVANFNVGSGGISVTGTTSVKFGLTTVGALANWSSSSVLGLTAATATTFDTTGGNITLSGAIGGTTTGALTKAGPGILTLSAANAYTGATTVNAGTLKLTSTSASPITVNSGATLIGTGATTSKLLTMNAGSTLTVGTTGFTSAGVNFAGATTLAFDTPLTNSTVYTVLTYGATGATNPGNFTSNARGTLTQDVANNKFTFTASTGTRTWNTTDGTWDNLTTASFVEGDQKFSVGDAVVFNDPATAATVTLVGALVPTSVAVTNTNNYTFSGTGYLSGSTALSKAGTGTLTMNNGHTFTGGITITGGTLEIGGAGALGVNGAINSYAGAVANAGTLKINSTAAQTLAGVISGTGTLVKDNSGTLTLTGINTYSGGTTVNGGNLLLNNGADVSGTGRVAGTVTVNSGATLTLNGANTAGLGWNNQVTALTINGGTVDAISGSHIWNITSGITMTGGKMQTNSGVSTTSGLQLEWNRTSVTTNAAATSAEIAGRINIRNDNSYTGISFTVADGAAATDLLVSAAITQAAAGLGITKAGAGLMSLTGVNSFSGGTTISAGTLEIGGAGQLGSGAYGGAIANAGTFKFNSTANQTLSGILSGAGTFVKDNTSTLTLTGVNTYTGATTITAGTLEIGGAGQLNSGTYAGAIANAGTLKVKSTAAQTFSGVISGAGTLVKENTGVLSLSAQNTFTGGTTVNAGTLKLTGGGGASGTIRGTITVNSGATFDLGAGDVTGYGGGASALTTINLVGGTMNVSVAGTGLNQTLGGATINMTGASLTGVANSNLDFFQGTSAINTLASAATSTISGVKLQVRQAGGLTFTIADGVAATDLQVNSVISSEASFTTQPVIKAGAGVMTLTGINTYTGPTQITAGTLELGGAGQLGSGTYAATITNAATFKVNSTANQTLSGVLGGAGNFVKDNAGVLTVSGTSNTYTGPVTVQGGYLVVTGTLPNNSALSLLPASAAGAGITFVNNAANLPANISTLTMGNATGTSQLAFDLGTASDTLATSAAAVANGSIVLSANGATGFGPGTYNLISAASGLTTTGATYSLGTLPGGYTYAVTATDTLVQLTVAAATTGGNLYWRGDLNSSWAKVTNSGVTNWYTDAAGTVNALYTPMAASTVIFSTTNAAGPTVTTTVDSAVTINDLQFSNAPAGVTAVTINPGTNPLTGLAGSLSIAPANAAAGITVPSGSGVINIAAPVVLGAPQTWTVDSSTPGSGTASSLTVSGAISGTAANSLTFTTAAGSTPIILSAAAGTSTYSGATTISANTLVQGGATNAFSANTAWTVNGTLNTGAFNQATGSLVAGAGIVQNGSPTNAVLTIGTDNLSTATFAGTIQNGAAGTLSLAKAGTGTQILSGTNTYTGATVVSAGTLKAGSATALGNTSSLTVTSPGTFDLAGNNITIATLAASTGTITDSSSAGSGGLLKVNTSITTAITGLVSGSVAVQYSNGNGSNAFSSNAANTYSGGTYLGMGNTTAASARYGASSVTIGNGVGGALTSGIFGTGPIFIGKTTTDAGQIYVSGASTINNPVTYNSVLGTDVVGGIRVDAATTLAGTQTAGLTAISYGSYSAAATATVTGRLTGSGTFTGTITNIGGNLGGGTVIGTNAGLIIGASTNNTTTVVLNNAAANNNYTGDTYVTAKGILQTNAADQLPSGSGTGDLYLTGPFNLQGNSQATGALNGAGTVDGISGTPTLTIGGNNASGSFSGILKNTAGTLTLTKSGSGTQTLTGASTFTGAVNANGGLLAFATSPTTAGPLGNSTTVNLNGGGISYTGSTTNSLNRSLAIGAGNGTVDVANALGTLTVAAVTSTGGNLVKTGTGTLNLTSATTLNLGAAGVVVNDGTLQGSFGTAGIGSITVGATGNLSFQNNAADVLTLGGAGALTLTNGAKLGLELGASGTNDQVIYANGSGTGSVTLNFYGLTGFGAGSYTLLSSANTGGLSGLTFQLGSAPVGYNYNITNDGTTVALAAVAYMPTFWNNTQGDGSWANTTGSLGSIGAGAGTNFTSDLAGTTDIGHAPAATETVVFNTSAVIGPNVSTTLDGNRTIDSLQFNGSGTPAVSSVVIAQGTSGTLTLKPASASGGISIFTGGGNVTITAPVTLDNTLSSSQTWGVADASSTLDISGNVALNANITKTGAGTLILSGSNSGSGNMTLSAGKLHLNSATAIGSGTLTLAAGTTIDNSSLTPVALLNNNAQVWNGDFTFVGGSDLSFGTGAATLGANVTATTSASILTVGAISDSGSNRNFTKAGAGTLAGDSLSIGGSLSQATGSLTITNAATIGGTLSASAGTLSVGGTSSVTGAVTVSGATVSLNGFVNTFGNNVAVTSGAFTSAGITNITGAVTGSGGTLTLNGPGTIGGIVTVNGGAVSLNGTTNSLGSNVNVSSGSLTIAGTANVNGAVTASGGTLTISGPTTVSGALIVSGATVNLNAANTLTSGTNLLSGTLNIGDLGALGTSTLTITGGTLNNTGTAGTLTGNNPQAWNGNFTFTGTNSLNLGTGTVTMNASRTVTVNANALTVDGTLNGTGATLTKSGVGTLQLAGTGNTLGGLSISGTAGNTVELIGSSSTTVTGGVNISPSATGGVLNIKDSATLTTVNLFLGEQPGFAGTVNQSGTSAVTISGQMRVGHWSTETSTYNISGGTLTLTGTPTQNTFTTSETNGTLYLGIDGTGVLNQSGGTVSAPGLVLDNRGDTSGSGNTDTYTLTGGTLILGQYGIQGNTSTAINLGAGTVKASATWTTTMSLPATLTGTGGDVTFDTNGFNIPISGVLSGAGGLIKSGAGNLILSGAETYAGATTINGGTLRISGSANRLPAGTAVTLANSAGATLDLNSLNQTIGSLAGGGATGGNVTLGTAALTISGSTNTVYAGVISGSGTGVGLTRSGTGETELAGTNTFTGKTSITGGKLIISTDSNLGATPGSTVADQLTINNATLRVKDNATLATNRGITLAGTTATVEVDATKTANYAGIVAGTALTKSGTGTLSLTGSNTYTGDTSVTAGSLQSKSLTNLANTTVASGASLTVGDGNTGATIRQASLTVDGTTTLTASSPATMPETGSNNATAHVGTLAVTGTLNLMNNDLMVDNGSYTTIFNAIKSGRDAGTGTGYWDGAGINTGSAAAQAVTVNATALGMIQNLADPSDALSGPMFTTAGGGFDGITTRINGSNLNGSEILVKYTYYGDFDLDGKLTSFDFALLDAGYAGAKQLVDNKPGWFFGDADYNGMVDVNDYNLVQNAYGKYTSGSYYNNQTLPEPSTLVLGGLGVIGLLTAYRRRRAVGR